MKAKNEKVINKAFERLNATKHRTIIDGLRGLLDAAVTFALQRHHERHLGGHLESGDSYGWAIGYKGSVVDLKITVGTNYAEDASVEDTLNFLASEHSDAGYVGIVMAGMEPSYFYKVEHEEEILYDTINLVAGDFDRYFMQI